MSTEVQGMYDRLIAVITDIDEKLDSLDDTAGVTKRKIVSDLVEANKETWEPAAAQFVEQISALDEETLVGVYKGFDSAFRAAFEEKVKAIIEAKAENAPKATPLISEEEVPALSATRSELYQQIKMAVTLAKAIDGVDLEMPKTRRGSKGKRGPRAMSLMVWAINGEELNPQPAKFKDLAELLGFAKSSELTAFLKSKDVDTTTPEDNKLEVELPDGRLLTGYIPEGAIEAAGDSDSDDDDDDDDEASTEE